LFPSNSQNTFLEYALLPSYFNAQNVDLSAMPLIRFSAFRVAVVTVVVLYVQSATGYAQLLTQTWNPSIYEAAASQWMCQALREQSPRIFFVQPPSCEFANASPSRSSLPTPDSATWSLAQHLFFPSPESDQLGAIKSLFDLYQPLLLKKLSDRKLPKELAILPVLLTGLNPHYTDARGRAGMWAMDYLQARRQGLRIDEEVDERCGGDFTTDAAVAILSIMFERYSGDVSKVILAWIYSPAYVELYSSNWPENLPREARQSLALFNLTACLMERTQAPNRLQNYFDVFSGFEQLFFTDRIEVAALQEVLKENRDVLRAWNPVYTGSFVDPTYRRVPYQLPLELAQQYHSRKEEVVNWKPELPKQVASVPSEERFVHIVRSGETLGGIAQRYKVKVSELKSWNKLRSDRIQSGQRLTVIRSTEASVPRDMRMPEVQVSQEEEPQTPEPLPIYHRVRSGENLWTIAKRYPGVSPALIMEWNSCDEKLRPGQRLKIYR